MAAPITGRFVWHELHTSDRNKAIAFYKKLLGNWETKDVEMGPGEPYGLCMMDGKDFAGITKSMAPAGVPPHWLPYLAYEDVDAGVKRVTELGGKVQMAPMDIPNVGRFAVVMDPQGAAFALYKDAKARDGAEPERPPVGAFCWDELMTSDPAAAAKFYTQLFGYGTEEHDMGPMGTYRIMKRGDRQTAGIMKLPPGVPHPHWLAYIHVADVDASTVKAKELGAQVFTQPMDIPNIGRFSVIGDPTGAAIALFKGSM
jgi:predicted enzyme related to lactoylglutathione lyase